MLHVKVQFDSGRSLSVTKPEPKPPPAPKEQGDPLAPITSANWAPAVVYDILIGVGARGSDVQGFLPAKLRQVLRHGPFKDDAANYLDIDIDYRHDGSIDTVSYRAEGPDAIAELTRMIAVLVPRQPGEPDLA